MLAEARGRRAPVKSEVTRTDARRADVAIVVAVVPAHYVQAGRNLARVLLCSRTHCVERVEAGTVACCVGITSKLLGGVHAGLLKLLKALPLGSDLNFGVLRLYYSHLSVDVLAAELV